MRTLVWLYSVNSLAQAFIYENKTTRRQMTIDESIFYLNDLIDYYDVEKILIKSKDFHSLEYAKELIITIENRIEKTIPIEVLQ